MCISLQRPTIIRPKGTELYNIVFHRDTKKALRVLDQNVLNAVPNSSVRYGGRFPRRTLKLNLIVVRKELTTLTIRVARVIFVSDSHFTF